MLTALARRVAKPLLENALGAYLPEELDLNQLELHVPDGRLRLRSLALHAEELNRSFFPDGPVYVQTAVIAELMSEVPYKQLATQPCRVEARGVHIRMALGRATLGPAPQELSMLLDVLPSTPPSTMKAGGARPDMNTTAIDSLTHFLERLLLQLHLSASDIVVELQTSTGAIFRLCIPELKAESRRLELKKGAELLLVPPGLRAVPVSLARLEPGSAVVAGGSAADDGSLSVEATFAALRLLVAPLQLQELSALLAALQTDAAERGTSHAHHAAEEDLPPVAPPKRVGTPVETALDDADRGVIALLEAGLVADAEPDLDVDDPNDHPGSESEFKEARGPAPVEPAAEGAANGAAPAIPPRVSMSLALESVCVSVVTLSTPNIAFLAWTPASAPCLSTPSSLTMHATNTRLTATHHAESQAYALTLASCGVALNNQHPITPPCLRLLTLSDQDEEQLDGSEGARDAGGADSALSLGLTLRTHAADAEEAVDQRQVSLRAPRLSLFYQPRTLPLLAPYIAVLSSSASTTHSTPSSSPASAVPANAPPPQQQPQAPGAQASAQTQTNVSVSVGRFSVHADVPDEGRLVAQLSGLSLQGVAASETKLLGDADALLLTLHPTGREPPILLAEAALRHSAEAAPTPLELTLRPAPPPQSPASSVLPSGSGGNISGGATQHSAVHEQASPMQSAAEGPFSAFMSSFEGRRARRVEAREEELARFRHESVAAAAAVLALALPTLRLEVPMARVPLVRRIVAALGPPSAENAKSKPEDLPRAAVALTVGDATVVVRGERGDTVEASGEAMRLLLSVRHNGGPASYAAFALGALRVSDWDAAAPTPAPFLLSVARAAPDAPPALSLAAELPLGRNSTSHDVLLTLRGVAFDATPRTRPASLLYASLTASSASVQSPPSPAPATPPPLPKVPAPSAPPPSVTLPVNTLPVVVVPPTHSTPPTSTATPSPTTPSTPAASVHTSLTAEDAWVWVDSAPVHGPCARLALRVAKLDVQPEEADTLLLIRGAAFFLRADGGGRPLAVEGPRPAGGAWADIGGADFMQLTLTPLLVSVQCPALKLALCADSYASLIALSSSFSAPPSGLTDAAPVEVRTLSVLDSVDDAAFAPPLSTAASGLIEDYAGEQSAMGSASIYGSVLLSAPHSPVATAANTPLPKPVVTQIPPTRPPVRSFAEVQAALKASDPNTPPLRHTAAHATAGAVSQEERPRLEPVEPSGAPKSPNPLADLLRRMNLSRLLPAFAAHRVDLDVLRAVVAKGQEADLAALLKLSVQEQAQLTAAVRSLDAPRQPAGAARPGATPTRSDRPDRAQSVPPATPSREQYRRDSGAKWLGPSPELIDEYAPAPPPQGPAEGQWKLEVKESGILLRFYTGEDFGSGRDAAHIECRLEALAVTYTTHAKAALGSPAAAMELSIGELNAIDALQPKGPAGFALRLLCADSTQPRVLNTPTVHVQWRLVAAAPEPEHWLHIHATPLSMHLTQAAWEFLEKFFAGDASAAPSSPQTQPQRNGAGATVAAAVGPFIQRCQMAPLSLKLSYEPELTRGIDVGLLRQGATSELLKLVPLKNSQFRFAAVDVAGVMGWMSLYNHVKLHWLAAMYTQHVFSYAAGVTAVHHVGQVAEGLYELVYTPFAQSRRDGRLVLGLQRGASAAFRTLLSEAAALGLSLASGAHKLVGGQATPAQPTAGAGLQAAYGSVARQAREAGAVVSIPLVEYQRSGTTGLVKAVLRAVPVLLLLPARGLTETASQTLAGLREQLEGTEFHAKYAPHNG